MDAGPRIDGYRWRGGCEAMLRWGPDAVPTVVVALPLFEEANRTRATLTATLRSLATRGIAGALPDLPGTGDSLVATVDARLADWREAFAAAVGSLRVPVHIVAIRGGALIVGDAEAASRWFLAPQEGAAAVRELHRVRALGDDGSVAGNIVGDELLAALADAVVEQAAPSRTVRLAADRRPADATLAFAPPWRRAEPERDTELAQALADDVAGWMATCGG